MTDGFGERVLEGARTVTPAFVRRSFALKFFVALLAIGLVVGAVGAYGTEQIRGEFQTQVHQEHADVAKQQANQVGRWHGQNSQFAETMARSVPVQRANATTIQSHFATELRGRNMGSEELANLHYVNLTSGTVAASTKSSFRGEDVAVFNETVRGALDGSETTVTSTYLSEATLGSPQPRVAYVTPVSSRNAAVVYTVPTELWTGSFAGDSESVSLAVDGDGRVTFHESGKRLLSKYGEDNGAPEAARELGPATSGALRAGPAGSVLSSSATIDHQEYVVGYAQVVHSDWVVLVHTNVESAYGTVQRIANQGMIATLVGIAAIGVIGAVLGRNTSRALQRLTRKTERMQTGDLDVEIQSGRIDTVGRLYAGFGAMRDSLKDQIETAERARKEAEVARSEAMATSEYLEEKAAAYSTVMEAAASGDLTRRMAKDGENDAMDAIATDFNRMISEIEKTTGQLKTFADRVEESGGVVGASADSLRDASEQVAESAQEISHESQTQRETLQDAAETADDAVAALESGDVETAHERVDAVIDSLTVVADATDRTVAEAQTVAGATEEQAAELDEVSQRAAELLRYVRPLYDVLDQFETDAEHEFVFAKGPSGSADGDGT